MYPSEGSTNGSVGVLYIECTSTPGISIVMSSTFFACIHRFCSGADTGGGVGDVRTPPQISPKCPFHRRISMMIHQVSTYQRCLWIMSI